MYRRGRVATAHHAKAVGEQQVNLGKQRGCLILRISGKGIINVALFFLVLVQLCLQTTFALWSALLEENMRGAHSCEETHKRHSAELTAAKWDSQSLLNGILKKTSILPRKWEFDKMGISSRF